MSALIIMNHVKKGIELCQRYRLGQEITDGRYYDDPAAADAKNMAAFEKYLID